MTLLSPRRGFVLTGGKSSRMGADKAFMDFRGRSLLAHALILMREVCPDTAIVGDPGRLAAYGTVLQDMYAGCGPLAGIHAALTTHPADLNLIIAVDMPFISSRLLSFLLAAAHDCDAIATVPRTRSGFQPLCAVYRPDFVALADSALRAGRYKIDALFSGTSLRIVDENELAAAGFSERNFFNVNTPDDLRVARDEAIKP